MADRLQEIEDRILSIRTELDGVPTERRRERLEEMLRYYEASKRGVYFFDLMGARGVY